MACRDVWNTWQEGLQSPQNQTVKPEGFVATRDPRWIQSIVTTLVCTYTTFINASWQSAGWPWWPVVPLLSPRVFWVQHLQIIFDFNALHMVQIFKSMLMVMNWYKTEISQYFHKWCFFHIYYQRDNVNRKGILWVKASEGTAILCERNHRAIPARHMQNHHQSAITHSGRDKMAAIFQTTVSNGFSWMKMYEFWLKFHWSLFRRVQLTIFQHWFR